VVSVVREASVAMMRSQPLDLVQKRTQIVLGVVPRVEGGVDIVWILEPFVFRVQV
jgi:hypothetical protein